MGSPAVGYIVGSPGSGSGAKVGGDVGIADIVGATSVGYKEGSDGDSDGTAVGAFVGDADGYSVGSPGKGVGPGVANSSPSPHAPPIKMWITPCVYPFMQSFISARVADA